MLATDPAAVKHWLVRLGSLTISGGSADEVAERIATYAPLLAEEYCIACFNRDTLVAAARVSKFFPVFAEICDVLSAWWRDHGDAHRPALPPPSVPPAPNAPSEAEVADVAAKVQAFIAELAASKTDLGPRKTAYVPVKLSPGQLIETWEAAAKQGLPGADARLTRLRANIGGNA